MNSPQVMSIEELKKTIARSNLTTQNAVRFAIRAKMIFSSKLDIEIKADALKSAVKAHAMATELLLLEKILRCHEETDATLEEIVCAFGLEISNQEEVSTKQLDLIMSLFEEELTKKKSEKQRS